MPPTDSMEKLPTVERTGRPIAVFSNSYARLSLWTTRYRTRPRR
jgi:hypothetical protein